MTEPIAASSAPARPGKLEFAKRIWMNDGDFVGLGHEQDPIAGANDGTGTFTIPKRPSSSPERAPLRDLSGWRVPCRVLRAGRWRLDLGPA